MTLLYFADTRFPIERANGTQTMATCHALAMRGHSVTLVVRPDSADPPRDPVAFYGLPAAPTLTIDRVPALGGPSARRAAFLIAGLARALRSRQTIVYTRDLGLAAFLLQIPGSRRPRVVYESHGIADVVRREMPELLGQSEARPSDAMLARLRRREERVWRHADAYVTITHALADELAERYGRRDHLAVIPDGADGTGDVAGSTMPGSEAGFRNPASEPGVFPVAAYAGHLYPWKGVDVFVHAMALAPKLRGLIIGGHPGERDLERVKALIAKLGLEQRVTITGLVPPNQVRTRLIDAGILVLPNTASAISERYTSPLKLFEYLTMGRPIVASDLPSIREVLTHEITALLVPAGDTAALASAMNRLLADPALATHLGHAAQLLAPNYTWARRAERIEALLEGTAS